VQGLDQDAAVERAKDTFVPLMKRNLMFWIPVQFIQFGFIDTSLQIPFLSVAGLCWTFIISQFAGNAKAATTATVGDASSVGGEGILEDEHIINVVDIQNIIRAVEIDSEEEQATVLR